MSTMQRLHQLVALFLAASALAAVATTDAPKPFTVTGRVFCDGCRAGFETTASHNIAGAVVQMQCRHFESMEVHHKQEATTDATGWYKIEMSHDHQEEICEVVLQRSPEPDCSEIAEFRDRDRVELTRNNGIKQSGVRFANPLAFFRKEPLPECAAILKSYDLKDASETP